MLHFNTYVYTSVLEYIIASGVHDDCLEVWWRDGGTSTVLRHEEYSRQYAKSSQCEYTSSFSRIFYCTNFSSFFALCLYLLVLENEKSEASYSLVLIVNFLVALVFLQTTNICDKAG